MKSLFLFHNISFSLKRNWRPYWRTMSLSSAFPAIHAPLSPCDYIHAHYILCKYHELNSIWRRHYRWHDGWLRSKRIITLFFIAIQTFREYILSRCKLSRSKNGIVSQKDILRRYQQLITPSLKRVLWTPIKF